MPKVTNPELLRELNSGATPTLKERGMEANIGQTEASTENSREGATTERQKRPFVVQKAAAEAKDATKKSNLPALTPGQQKMDEQFADDYLQWSVRGGRGDFEKAKAQLNEALGELEKSDMISGPVLGALPDWLKAFVAPSAVQYPEDVQEIAQRNLRAILGGQFAEKEGEKLIAKAFNPSLDEGANKIRVQRLLRSLSSAAQAKEDAAKYFEEHGTLVGWEGSLPSLASLDVDYDSKDTEGDDKEAKNEADPGLYDPNVAVTDEGAPGGDGDSGGGSGGGSGGDGGGDGGDIDTSGMLQWLGRGLGQGLGSMVEGAGSIPGMAVDPLMSLVYKYAGYNKPYSTGDVLREAVGLPDNPRPTSDLLIKGGTSALTGAGLARGAAALAQPGALKTALSTFGATPWRDAAAGLGASGASELARYAGFGIPGQVAASLIGGITGYGAGTGVYRAAVPHSQTPAGAAAERMKVDMLPADTGGATTRLLNNAALASPFSANSVSSAAQRSQDSLSRAAGRVAYAEGRGDIPTTEVAGEFLRKAAERYSAKTNDIGRTMYKQAFKAAGDVRLPATNAIKTIDGFLKGLRANPETNAGDINNLMKLRKDLMKAQTAEEIHDLRSSLSGNVYDGLLRSNKDKGRMKAIRGALTQDMLGFFDNNFMPGVANRIRKADKYWEQRVEHIDQVLQPIIGKEGYKGGEDIVRSVESMARGRTGGTVRLRRMMAEMTEDERKQVRATIIDRIGRPAEDSKFSPDTFFRKWQQMTPQAKNELFKDGKLRQSLDDIATLSTSMRESKNIAEHGSRKGMLTGNIGLQMAWMTMHAPTFVGGGVAQYLTGKLLSSPKFARWLANAPVKGDPAMQRRALDQLGVLASQDPVIRNDALALHQHLEKSFSRSPGMVNAEEEDDGRSEPPEE